MGRILALSFGGALSTGIFIRIEEPKLGFGREFDLFKAPPVFLCQSVGSPLAHIFLGNWYLWLKNDFDPFSMPI
jgi:hypothetical protein